MGIVLHHTRTCARCKNAKLTSTFPYNGKYCQHCFPWVERSRLKRGKGSLIPVSKSVSGKKPLLTPLSPEKPAPVAPSVPKIDQKPAPVRVVPASQPLQVPLERVRRPGRIIVPPRPSLEALKEAFMRRENLDKQVKGCNGRARSAYHLTHVITTDEWIAVLEAHNYTCALCGTDKQVLAMDHIYPLARGGEHTIQNIQPACLRCNSRKGARL